MDNVRLVWKCQTVFIDRRLNGVGLLSLLFWCCLKLCAPRSKKPSPKTLAVTLSNLNRF